MKRNLVADVEVAVALSGGIDSSIVLALCAKTFGPDKVLAIMMPERDSSPESKELATLLCEKFKVPYILEDITDACIDSILTDYKVNFNRSS